MLADAKRRQATVSSVCAFSSGDRRIAHVTFEKSAMDESRDGGVDEATLGTRERDAGGWRDCR
jgi:hypothetical protein